MGTTKEAILKDPEISEYVKTHQGAKERIEVAAERLANQNDAVQSVKKLFHALTEKQMRIFFSYKKADAHTAEKIVETLSKAGGSLLNICYMGDFGTSIVGKKWRIHIRIEIPMANWFVLLLPNPSEDRDWCLFETGLFEAQRTSADRLICLHHPEIEIPQAIEGYQNVAANIEEVEQFLTSMLVKDNPVDGMAAINPNLKDQIPDIAKDIVEAIVPPKKNVIRDIFEPWLELKIPNAKMMQAKEELDNATIVSANDNALDIFSFRDQPEKFGELRSGLSDQGTIDSRWIKELFHVVRRVAGGRKFFPIQAVLQKYDGKMYRPVLCAVDRKYEKRKPKKNGPIETYHVTFVEEVSHVDDSAIPDNVIELATILRFSFRFRWEMLEKYGTKALTEDDVVRVENAIKRIKKDWESRGMASDDSFINLFSPEKAKRIAEMLQDWREKKNDQGTGELDVALVKKDYQKIEAILNEFIPYSQEFVEITAERFSELAAGKWAN